MNNYCIELEHITKKFGKFTAVDDFSLKLETGKVYGIVGPNGAGKSTTMSMIMGTLCPTKGQGSIMGYDLGSKEALQVLGYSPEFTSFYSDMSCMEYLWYMGTLGGLSNKEASARAAELIKKFNLEEHAFSKVAKFSTGMKKKVSLAQAMIHNPQVLLLDEPTANLDPTSRMEILDTVRKMVNEQHLTVLISSHVLTELETVIDHVVMIDHGKLILNEDIKTAQEKFKNGIVVMETDNNEKILSILGDKHAYEVEENEIRFTTKESKELKKQIVKIVYENDLELKVLRDEVISLDSLYKQAIQGEKEQ